MSTQTSPESQSDQSIFKTSPTTIKALKALSTDELIARMRVGVECIDPRIFELTDDQLNQAWLPEANTGLWPIRVVLGHLADVEMVFATRIRKIFAEDNPILAIFDEHAFVDSAIYGCTEGSSMQPPIGGDVAAIHTLRSWLIAFLYQLEDQHWERTGMHPDHGPISIHTLAVYNCWHLERHAWFINAKTEKLLGPRPMPEACSTAGCDKPGCQCG
ncbi:MAG: DinB family protein [Phycisphaerales bacterium]